MNILAPGVYSRYTKKELNVLLETVDLVLIDLDGCLFPGITKVAVYKRVCLSLLRLGEYILFGRLLMGALIIVLMRFSQVLHLGPTNREIILYFAKMIRPVPFSYIEEAARLIPNKSHPGAKETLEILSKKARVGIISQGLDIVLKEYARQFRDAKTGFLDFWNGNFLTELEGVQNNSSGRFIFTSQDKELFARKRVEEFQAKKIMVIGHNSDDLGMMTVAKERKGIVVGFRPSRKVRRMCDIIITGKDWTGLKQIISLFQVEGKGEK